MPSITLADTLIWFAHCPKAGGTSVEQALVARFGGAVGHLHWGWDLWWRQGGWRVADPPNSPQHLIWHDALAQLPRAPDAVFAVVRDPVARMASEHRWQRRGRRGTRMGKALAHLPFPIWLRLMLAVARRNPYAFDNHFRPQAEFVPDGAVVFRLEAGLAPVGAWLDQVAGSADGAPIPHAIPSGAAGRIGTAEAALIARTFAEDYRRFGYPMPPAHSPGPDPLAWIAGALAPLVAGLDRLGRL
ncbi:MAG: hypothetical protein AAFU34_14040 [Pseudomonadota bacterium]